MVDNKSAEQGKIIDFHTNGTTARKTGSARGGDVNPESEWNRI